MALGFTESISALHLGLLSSVVEHNKSLLRTLVKDANNADLASFISTIENEQALWIMRNIPIENACEILPLLISKKINFIINEYTKEELRELFHNVAKDDAADIIESQPIHGFKKILSSLKPEDRIAINKLLQYDDDVVGSIMSVEFLWLYENATVVEATNYLRVKYEDAEELRHYYVVNDNNELVGFVDIQKIFFSSKEIKIRDIMDKKVIYISSYDKIDKAIEYFKKYDLPTIPVISKANELIGVVTHDDLIDVVEEETTEDIERQAGILPTHQSYRYSSSFRISTSRVSWLIILLISSTLSQIVLTIFQSQIDDILSFRITALLVSLVPVISGTAGNAGSQAVTSVVRSIALKELNKKMYWEVIIKELNISLYVGFLLATVNSLRMILFYGIENGEITVFDLILTLTTSFCLMIAITLAKITGATLPFLALILKKDPAAMATPLLTTLVDALTTSIFFSISLGILSFVI